MKENDNIKKAVDDIVRLSSSFEKWKQKVNPENKPGLISNMFLEQKHEALVKDHIKKGRSFLGSLVRYSRNQKNYLPHVANHVLAIENYAREHPDLARNYGWDKPLVAQRYRIPGSKRFIGIDDIKRRNEESNADVQSGSAPPASPPSTPPPPPPTSNPPHSPDDDDDGKNKASRQEANIGARGRYRDAMRNIRDPSHMERRRLYESFLEVDESTGKSSLGQRKAAAKKAREILAAEKANTKGVNENTKALAGIRAILGPYAKAFMPYYAANMLINGAKSDTAASIARVDRRTFGGLYGASKNIAGYNKMFRLMTSRGASEQDVMREYAGQKKWASTLMFGMGLDKIEALAMVLGKAPGPAEMRDPELMQKWLRENMRGITDLQAMQLSAMGVASDAFIEGARRGEGTDADSRASTLKRLYDSLYEQTGLLDNPFRKAQYLIGSTAASDISSRTRVGDVASLAMSGLGMFGKMYEHGGLDLTSMIPGLSSLSDLWKIASGLFGGISSDNVGDFRTIPRQTSVTVNINGNIDSEERAHSFAEQIGGVVRNPEK